MSAPTGKGLEGFGPWRTQSTTIGTVWSVALTDSTRRYTEAAALNPSSVISAAWQVEADADTAHVVFPDGCVDLVRTDDGRTFVAGPQTQRHRVHFNDPTVVLGLRLRPGAAGPLLRISASELQDQLVPAEDLGLRLPVTHSDDWAAQVASKLTRTWTDPADPEVNSLLTRLNSGRPPALYPSGHDERHLRRRFVRAVGITPRLYSRHRRLQRLLSQWRLDTGESRWADLAAIHSFSDQAHLCREIASLTGFTPTQLSTLTTSDSRSHTG